MERLRAMLSNDPNTMYPVLPKHGPPPPQRPRSPTAISISSSPPAPQVVAKPTKPARRGMVIESDEEESEQSEESVTDDESRPPSRSASVEERAPPSFPVPKPFKPPVQQRPPALPQPELYRYPSAQSQQSSLPFSKPASLVKPSAPSQSAGPDEGFDLRVASNEIETVTSASEAQKAMVELVQSNLADQDREFDPEDAIVEGFRDGIVLLPHQIVGREWMRERETGKKFGGILADDMGLGKTIQTLTRIVEGRPSKEDRKDWAPTTLVVCPVSLIGQWASEIKKMCVGLRVLEHVGASRTRDADDLSKYHVVITSYQTLTSEHSNSFGDAKDESKGKSKAKGSKQDDGSDSDDLSRALATRRKPAGRAKKPQDALFNVAFWRVVLDEAHTIKNRTAKVSIACCAVQSKYRWALTGTPLQNNVDELYPFFNFLRIRPLNDWPTFKEQISKPVKAGRSARAMKRLQIVLQAVMLRRTKTTTINGKALLELPARNVQVIDCNFDEGERAFYQSLEDKTAEVFQKLAAQGLVMKNYTSVLVMLLRLRQACDHPSLVTKDYRQDAEALDAQPAKETDEADALADIFAGLNVGKASKCSVCQVDLELGHKGDTCSDCQLTIAIQERRKTVVRHSRSLDLPPASTKINKILELLELAEQESKGSDKTIIFSQFTSMLDLIQPFLKDAGIRFVRYDGSMRSDQRKAALERITEDSLTKVILISFKAGGTGLNLTCCNRVILVDMWWNPALEDQAFDRAHRFGQKKDVHIYKLKVEETIEQRVLDLQERKRELAAAALGGGKLANSKLGLQDLMSLFRTGGHDDEDDD